MPDDYVGNLSTGSYNELKTTYKFPNNDSLIRSLPLQFIRSGTFIGADGIFDYIEQYGSYHSKYMGATYPHRLRFGYKVYSVADTAGSKSLGYAVRCVAR